MKIIILIIVALFVCAGLLVYFVFPGVLYQWAIGQERSKAGYELHQVEVEGLNWSYLKGGKGVPLVLLHGFGANKDNWTRVGPYLTEHFEVFAPDLPGFGESGIPPVDEFTILHQAQRLVNWLNVMGIKQFYLGGNSMGGQISAQVGALIPDRVLGLWLLAPGGVAGADISELGELVLNKNTNPLIVKTHEDFEFTMNFVFSERPLLPKPISAYLADQKIAREPFERKVFDQLRFKSAPIEEFVDRLMMPVLVTWGDEDRVLHVSGAAILDQLIRDSEIQILKGVGHLPMIEKPKEVGEYFVQWQGK